ncbi:MAG: hypothetical protein GX099_05335 [Clostridiaceae bacterium]|nr:hypothetical protein [Clostridiaceae bacterium]
MNTVPNQPKPLRGLRSLYLRINLRISDYGSLPSPKEPGRKELLTVFPLFLAISLFILFFNSTHSPFYRYSFSQDANIYMDIARAMRHGALPYRDVFDHKGIWVYFINYLGDLLFPNAMTGIYMILSVSCATFMFYAYRFSRLFLPNRPALIATLFLPIISHTGILYTNGGGSIEEYQMPIIMACLYYLTVIFRYAEGNSTGSRRRIYWGFFAVGFGCGLILWMKPTPIPAIAVSYMFLLFVLFRRKGIREATVAMFSLIGGGIPVSITCLLYLLNNGLISEMWSAYIVFNASYTGMDHGIQPELFLPLTIYLGVIPLSLAVAGIMFLRVETKVFSKIGALAAAFFPVGVFILQSMARRSLLYYFLVFVPFSAITLTAVVFYLLAKSERSPVLGRLRGHGKALVATAIALVLIVATAGSAIDRWDKGAVVMPKSEMERCGAIAAEYWKAEGDGTPPSVVCFFSSDLGINQLLSTYPQHRYFYYPGVSDEHGKEIRLEQESYIRAATADFIFSYYDTVERINPEYRLLFFGPETGYIYIYAREARE